MNPARLTPCLKILCCSESSPSFLFPFVSFLLPNPSPISVPGRIPDVQITTSFNQNYFHLCKTNNFMHTDWNHQEQFLFLLTGSSRGRMEFKLSPCFPWIPSSRETVPRMPSSDVVDVSWCYSFTGDSDKGIFSTRVVNGRTTRGETACIVDNVTRQGHNHNPSWMGTLSSLVKGQQWNYEAQNAGNLRSVTQWVT